MTARVRYFNCAQGIKHQR